MSDETNDTRFRESQEAGARHDDREARRRFRDCTDPFMNRYEAIAILRARMSGAPNYADYVAWLDRQTDYILIALAEGREVHAFPRQHAA